MADEQAAPAISTSPPRYTEERLKELIALATKLEFWDDVHYWERKLRELRENTP